jgi:hypothetical protein
MVDGTMYRHIMARQQFDNFSKQNKHKYISHEKKRESEFGIEALLIKTRGKIHDYLPFDEDRFQHIRLREVHS